MNYKREYQKIYEIALEKGWNTYWELEKITGILENIENKEFIGKLPIGIKRGFRFKNLENYAKHESDLSNKAREIFTHLIERGSRRNMNNSVNVLITLDKDKNLLEKTYYLGKKKKSKFFNRMGDLHSIYGDTIIEFLNEFSKKENIGNINKLEKEISKIVKDYFNITTISINEKDLNYIFSGYEKNKKLDETKRFTASLLMNEDIFSYRSITPEIEYFSEKNIEGIKINIEDKIQDSYDEAIKLLEKENINCKFYTNMMKNSSQILKIIKVKLKNHKIKYNKKLIKKHVKKLI